MVLSAHTVQTTSPPDCHKPLLTFSPLAAAAVVQNSWYERASIAPAPTCLQTLTASISSSVIPLAMKPCSVTAELSLARKSMFV